jgi:hypothetical protein
MWNRLSEKDLQAAITKAANFSGARLDIGNPKLLIVTLDITVAERDSANETYDFYIVAGDGVSEWDIIHFPQIATTGAKRYTARVTTDRLAEVTTGTPGVAAEPTGIMKTDTAAAGEGIKTLAAGKVRHGPLGRLIGHELVMAGTIVTGITYSLKMTAVP